MAHYRTFFEQIVGRAPYPYQVRMATQPWPEVVDVPTGLGKTAAVLGAWLWKLIGRDESTGRRLVYCLPMRTLVSQTARVAEELCSKAGPFFEAQGLHVPTVSVLMGGELDLGWETTPEHPAVLVGTQDMLISRALNRGYGMSRFKWPVHFGLLHSDVLWVLDETQLMGVSVETSAQLEGLRRSLGTYGPSRTMWMSATLGREQLATIDHPEPEGGFEAMRLDAADLDQPAVRQRTDARKAVVCSALRLERGTERSYARALAAEVLALHERRGGLTLVVVNRVGRAQGVFTELRGHTSDPVALVHSRFRRLDRIVHEDVLRGTGDRIVVATQAVEAGVDVSAKTLVTELAPWPALVQRIGRCNRYGERDDGQVHWVDIDHSKKDDLALPYNADDLDVARAIVSQLEDAGPGTLAKVEYTPPSIIRPVLRRRDFVDLFDTSPDLLGNDLDVARYVRDGSDTDVQIYWRTIDGRPSAEISAPHRDELVSVSLASASAFIGDARKRAAKQATSSERDALRAWVWDPLDRRYTEVERLRPGQTILLSVTVGGYDDALGWTGTPGTPVRLSIIDRSERGEDAQDRDDASEIGRWVLLSDHLAHVEQEAATLAESVGLDDMRAVLAEAGRWHDVGKAHEEFQDRLRAGGAPPTNGYWAKAARMSRPTGTKRPGFRHELASALAYLAASEETDAARRQLVAYLVAAHHGKIRMSFRALPGESAAPDGRAFARGVWEGDVVPSFDFRDGSTFPATVLTLEAARLGDGSWLSGVLALRNDPDLGPLRLAVLETIVRVADWRASHKEQKDEYDEE